jgi:hypothetical protein
MNGIPKPLELAVFVRQFEQEVQAASPPLWMQRLALAPLGWLARRRGYDARYGAAAGARAQQTTEDQRAA